jgi:hypothetical protein
VSGGYHFAKERCVKLHIVRIAESAPVSQADEYRIKAAELRAKATREGDPLIQADFQNLALAYIRLALQADRNQQIDVSYETPSPKKEPTINAEGRHAAKAKQVNGALYASALSPART